MPSESNDGDMNDNNSISSNNNPNNQNDLLISKLGECNFRKEIARRFLEEGLKLNDQEPILGGKINANYEMMIKNNKHDEFVLDVGDKYHYFRLFFEKTITDAWKASDVDVKNERKSYLKATPDIRFLVKEIVKFNITTDGKVESNTVNNILPSIKKREIYIVVLACTNQESTHIYTYIDIAKALGIYEEIVNGDDPIEKYNFVKLKLDWMDLWMNDKMPFRVRLLAIKCVEQIHFVSFFLYIYWIETMFPNEFEGLVASNKIIAAEESGHGEVASEINKYLVHKLTDEEAHEIIKSAVHIEIRCIEDIISNVERIVNENNMESSLFLTSLKYEDLVSVVKYKANIVCIQHGVEKLYPEINKIPDSLSWYHKISISTKTNNFEKRSLDYIKVKLFEEQVSNFDAKDF